MYNSCIIRYLFTRSSCFGLDLYPTSLSRINVSCPANFNHMSSYKTKYDNRIIQFRLENIYHYSPYVIFPCPAKFAPSNPTIRNPGPYRMCQFEIWKISSRNRRGRWPIFLLTKYFQILLGNKKSPTLDTINLRKLVELKLQTWIQLQYFLGQWHSRDSVYMLRHIYLYVPVEPGQDWPDPNQALNEKTETGSGSDTFSFNFNDRFFA